MIVMASKRWRIGPNSLRRVAPELSQQRAIELSVALGEAMHKFGIKDRTECAHFIAQCAHESGGFIYKEEIWGPTKTQAGYWKRKDLGNFLPWHGKGYRGRGFIQITGRENYKKVGKVLGHSFMGGNAKDLALDKYACESAAWYWATRVRPFLHGELKIVTVTKLINGGTNGLRDRELRTIRALPVSKYLTPRQR